MAAEAEAAREARAKIVRASGEQKATNALKEAANVLSESPAALQLRYLQTLSSIGNEKNTTIIFPVPIDILGHFMKGQKVTKGESRGSRKSRSRPSGLDLHTPTARPGTDQTLLQGEFEVEDRQPQSDPSPPKVSPSVENLLQAGLQ